MNTIKTEVDLKGKEFLASSSKDANLNSIGRMNEKERNISGSSLSDALNTWEETYAKDEKSRPGRREVERSGKLSLINKRDDQHDGQRNNINSKETRNTEHVEMFNKIMKFISLSAMAFGIQVAYQWIPKKHIMWWFTGCLMTFTWICIFYTQGIHISNGDMLRVLEPCAIYGIASSCTQKVVGYLTNRNRIISLLMHIKRICLRNETGSRAAILNSRLRKTFKFLQVFVVGVMSSVGIFTFMPIKKYINEGQLTSLLPLEIMLVDQSTLLGFVIGNLVMITMGLYAAMGSTLYGAAFVFSVLNYNLQVELIEQDFKDLDEMWTNKTCISVPYKQAYLRNILIKRQDLERYMMGLKDTFERKFFFYFCFNYFSQIICLFEITKNDWTPGYAIAQGLFTEMMFYCVLGTQTTVADDKLCAIIYGTHWYEYDLRSQRMIQLLLHQSQHSKEIKLGFIGGLNVVTGIQIVKSIYTYYTVLTELL